MNIRLSEKEKIKRKIKHESLNKKESGLNPHRRMGMVSHLSRLLRGNGILTVKGTSRFLGMSFKISL
ncbi:MAG: hypothetical protein PVH88_22530 [Ignavibacteria bacterium]|jgi:hypothetical protein